MGRGVLRVTDIFLRDILLLPDNYVVVDIRHDAFSRECEILFDSTSIPETKESCKLPKIQPIFTTHYKGTVSYSEISEIKFE